MKPNFLFFFDYNTFPCFPQAYSLKESARLCCLLSYDIFVIQRNDKNLENIYSHDAIDSFER